MEKKMLVLICSSFFVGWNAFSQSAQATTISFDDVASGTRIDSFYQGNYGVTFTAFAFNQFQSTFSDLSSGFGIYAAGDSTAPAGVPTMSISSSNTISLNTLNGNPALTQLISEGYAIRAAFNTAVSNVSVGVDDILGPGAFDPTYHRGNFWPSTVEPELWAFDSNGTFITRDLLSSVGSDGAQYLSVSTNANNIAYVMLAAGGQLVDVGGSTSYSIFDNLSFTRLGTPIPEPSGFLLFVAGLAGLWFVRKAS